MSIENKKSLFGKCKDEIAKLALTLVHCHLRAAMKPDLGINAFSESGHGMSRRAGMGDD